MTNFLRDTPVLSYFKPLFACLTVVCASCATRGPGAEFYYPVDDLTEGLVYAYYPAQGATSELSQPHFWYYRSVESGDSMTLAATYYSADFEPRQYVRERIVSTGVLLRDLRLYNPTDTASEQTIADIAQPALFSFEPPDTSRVLISSISFRQNLPSRADDSVSVAESAAVYTVTRNRHYLNDTTLLVEGAEVEAQIWAVRELIEQDSSGTLSLASSGKEIYGRGLGLVYRERIHSDGSKEAYVLARRFPMEELVEMRGSLQ